MAQGDDVGHPTGIDRREDAADLACVFFVHGHGDAQPALTPAQGVHDLEAAHMRSQQQRAAAVLRPGQQHVLAFESDIEFFESTIDQIHAIVNRRRKGKDLQEAVAGRRCSTQCQA